MSKKVHILADKVSEETRLVAIVSNESFLPFVLEFNTATNFQLKPGVPVEIKVKDTSFKFSQAMGTLQENTHMTLFRNKQDGQILFKEAKTFDYLILIRGENCDFFQRQLISKLKTLSHISLVTSIDANSLKSLNKIPPLVS